MGWSLWLHFVASGALAGGVSDRDIPTAPRGRGDEGNSGSKGGENQKGRVLA